MSMGQVSHGEVCTVTAGVQGVPHQPHLGSEEAATQAAALLDQPLPPQQDDKPESVCNPSSQPYVTHLPVHQSPVQHPGEAVAGGHATSEAAADKPALAGPVPKPVAAEDVDTAGEPGLTAGLDTVAMSQSPHRNTIQCPSAGVRLHPPAQTTPGIFCFGTRAKST